MDPIVLNQLAQLRGQMERAPGVTPAQLSELLRLRRKGEVAEEGTNEALERLKTLGSEARSTSEDVQNVYGEVPVYKRPERKGPSRGSINFGLALGALGALANVDNPQNLTGTVIGGAKERSDQEYYDQIDSLKEKMELDRQSKLDKVSGLQAKMSGIGTEMDIAQTELSQKSGDVSRIGAELFNREQAAQGQSNWQKNFDFTVGQATLENERWLKQFGFQLDQFEWSKTPQYALAKREYDAMVKDGVPPEDANLMAFGRFIMDGANAKYQPDILKNQFHLSGKQLEEADENLKRIRLMNEWLPKQLQQEFAANELSMANTRQMMAARSIDMANARKSGNTAQLTLLETEQKEDYNTQIDRALGLADKIREAIAGLDPTTDGYTTKKRNLEREAAKYEKEADAARKERNKLLGE